MDSCGISAAESMARMKRRDRFVGGSSLAGLGTAAPRPCGRKAFVLLRCMSGMEPCGCAELSFAESPASEVKIRFVGRAIS